MTYENIKELIRMIDESDFVNFELTTDVVSLRMSKCAPVVPMEFNREILKKMPVVEENVSMKPIETHCAAEQKELLAPKAEGNLVKSPIVGTFYASTSPDKSPLVLKGNKVKKGDILCIVEAMKLMNEITSEFDGEVMEVLAENGQLVEYGQPLFCIV